MLSLWKFYSIYASFILATYANINHVIAACNYQLYEWTCNCSSNSTLTNV